MRIESTIKELCVAQNKSSHFIIETRRINFYFSVLIIALGLIGNTIAIGVFSRKKIRSSSTSIYLLCLSVSDSLYLVAHFFEDTLKSYIDHFIHKTEFINEECLVYSLNYDNVTSSNAYDQSFVKFINIIDRFDFFCRSINFVRYFLRFTSAYIIVSFTIQRTRAIRSPLLKHQLESKLALGLTAFVILLFGLVSASWIPFMLQADEGKSTCKI